MYGMWAPWKKMTAKKGLSAATARLKRFANCDTKKSSSFVGVTYAKGSTEYVLPCGSVTPAAAASAVHRRLPSSRAEVIAAVVMLPL